MPFFVLFVIIPLSEIFVFMKVSGQIGLGTALLMALGTAILGGALVRYQGIQTLLNAQESMQKGTIPSKELFDGLCIVAAGATLITPGFITDVLGFALLVPAIRGVLRDKLSKNTKFHTTGFNNDYSEFSHNKQHHRPDSPDVIDVEFETIDKNEKS
ncbi:MAG: FxsA family protein [Alphaproteobacteria bacterium]